MANEQGYLTNAGALVADESPIRWSRLFCTRWNGLNKSGGTIDAFDDAEYSGSVLSLIDNGEAFIKRNAKLMWRKTANSREEMPEYVERSYHEALVNALAHRDYLVNGSEVHIDIYDDRMEIYSPGACRTVPLFRTEIHLQFRQREETRFWQIYLIGWDIWNVKVVDLEKSSAAMNFRSTMTKVKSRLLDQIGTSLQL